jgi:hypothetical protein
MVRKGVSGAMGLSEARRAAGLRVVGIFLAICGGDIPTLRVVGIFLAICGGDIPTDPIAAARYVRARGRGQAPCKARLPIAPE